MKDAFAAVDAEMFLAYSIPRGVKITFKYAPSAYAQIESRIDDKINLANLTEDEIQKFLVNDLINVQLPKVLKKLKSLSKSECQN